MIGKPIKGIASLTPTSGISAMPVTTNLPVTLTQPLTVAEQWFYGPDGLLKSSPPSYSHPIIDKDKAMAMLVNHTSNNLSKRLVRVLVVDSDANVPSESSKILDQEMFTTLNDEGIKLSISLVEKLEDHNKNVRSKLTRETNEGQEVKLKDLSLNDVVVRIITLATF